MGADRPTRPERLSQPWRLLASALVSRPYRVAMSLLVGRDLVDLPIEVNVFRYDAGSYLGPHVDLAEKLVTHILYFNECWDEASGGRLQVLRSGDARDVAGAVPPMLGSSAVLVRSDRSWHAVEPVVAGSGDRRSVTVTFYAPGAVSTMWPPGADIELIDVA
jgi:Rps23 Pro-64 3,4-dihydroxylase Tpa1-like proline 4-hydroxylase